MNVNPTQQKKLPYSGSLFSIYGWNQNFTIKLNQYQKSLGLIVDPGRF